MLFYFPYESAVVLVATAKLLHQMHTASPSSFLGALGASLWIQCRAQSNSWMRGALRWWGWCFGLDIGAQRGRPALNGDGYPAWISSVHAHAVDLAGRGKDALRESVYARIRERFRSEALMKLRVAGAGPFSYDAVLRLLVEKEVHFGEINKLVCSRSALRSLCMICYGGLEVGRTRALYQYPEQLARAGISNELRRCCLYCLNRGVCVLDSEWHFVLYCPHFRDLRNSRLRNIDIGSEFLDSPRPSVALINLLSLCAKEPTRLQSLGSFVRLSLRLREKWLQENVSCGLQLTQPAQVGLAAAHMYSNTEAFTHGVAISI